MNPSTRHWMKSKKRLEKFVDTWEQSRSLSEVTRELCIPQEIAAAIAGKLLCAGVMLAVCPGAGIDVLVTLTN
jgi:hypothetical protein